MPLPPAARPLARLAVGWAALSELVPPYPLYALLFLDTGLSPAEVSLLFAVWSVTALVTEVPAGVLADRWSRRMRWSWAGSWRRSPSRCGR